MSVEFVGGMVLYKNVDVEHLMNLEYLKVHVIAMATLQIYVEIAVELLKQKMTVLKDIIYILII